MTVADREPTTAARSSDECSRCGYPRTRTACARCLYVEPTPSDTASADLDWHRAWELAAPVVVAARRFTLAEAEGNDALIEDSHFQLLRALTDYFAGGPPGESPIESVRRHLGC